MVEIIIVLTVCVFGCTALPERVVHVEHAVAKNEKRLVYVNNSYDLTEQDLGRMRLSVFELVERGRVVSKQLEKAAYDFQMAAVHNHLASNDFIHAAAPYQRAANTYRQIASMIILLASSGRFLETLCKQPANVHRYRGILGAFGVQLDDRNIEPLIPRILEKQAVEQRAQHKASLELPLPVMNVLVKRAAQMLLCDR